MLTSSSVMGFLPSFITNPEYPTGMLRTHPFRQRPLKDALRAKNYVKILISDKTKIYQSASLTLKLPRSCCHFSPLTATHFLVTQLQEFGVRSGK